MNNVSPCYKEGCNAYISVDGADMKILRAMTTVAKVATRSKVRI